jgi:hypothetical protein
MLDSLSPPGPVDVSTPETQIKIKICTHYYVKTVNSKNIYFQF